MKHSGKATTAALRLLLMSLLLLVGVFAVGYAAYLLWAVVKTVAGVLVCLWLLFVAFSLYFFRDPEPKVPTDSNAVVAPAHGKVDVIEEMTETVFMNGRCRRVSIFLSVFDVHVQQAPIAGKIACRKHTPGQFLNAMKSESAMLNENILIGFDSSERPGEKIGVRLIAGLIARRIVPWVTEGDTVARGERISLIQFGSRVDLYLPLTAQVKVNLGDRVVGGETIVATRA